MTQIPKSLLHAGAGMFSAYVTNLTPGRLEQLLNDASKPTELKPGYTPKEFCALAKMSRQTLHNMEKRGDIKLARVGRIVRVSHAEAERFLNGGEQHDL